MSRYLNSLDVALLDLFNNIIANPLFDLFFPVITDASNWVVPVIVFYIFLFRKDWRRALSAVALATICIVVTDAVAAQLIKPLVGRIRPSHELGDTVRLLVSKGGKFSFPSNHAANSMAFAVVTSFFYPAVNRWLLTIALLVAFSRVYVGVHYPGDVVSGALVGCLFAYTSLHLYSSIRLRFTGRIRRFRNHLTALPLIQQ